MSLHEREAAHVAEGPRGVGAVLRRVVGDRVDERARCLGRGRRCIGACARVVVMPAVGEGHLVELAVAEDDDHVHGTGRRLAGLGKLVLGLGEGAREIGRLLAGVLEPVVVASRVVAAGALGPVHALDEVGAGVERGRRIVGSPVVAREADDVVAGLRLRRRRIRSRVLHEPVGVVAIGAVDLLRAVGDVREGRIRHEPDLVQRVGHVRAERVTGVGDVPGTGAVARRQAREECSHARLGAVDPVGNTVAD